MLKAVLLLIKILKADPFIIAVQFYFRIIIKLFKHWAN